MADVNYANIDKLARAEAAASANGKKKGTKEFDEFVKDYYVNTLGGHIVGDESTRIVGNPKGAKNVVDTEDDTEVVGQKKKKKAAKKDAV